MPARPGTLLHAERAPGRPPPARAARGTPPARHAACERARRETEHGMPLRPRPRASGPPRTTSSTATTSSRARTTAALGAHPEGRPALLSDKVARGAPHAPQRGRDLHRVLDDEEGIERVWPLDVLPRIITASEWAPIEAGLDAARAGAEPLPRGPLRRAARPAGRRGTGRADLPRQGLPPRDPRHPAAARHLRAHRGHRRRARRRRAATSCSRTTCARRPASRT